MRSVAEIEVDIEASTQRCMDEHHKCIFCGSREDQRGECESQVRADYAAELQQAQDAENTVNTSINKSASRLAAGFDAKLFGLLLIVLIFLLAIVYIFNKK